MPKRAEALEAMGVKALEHPGRSPNPILFAVGGVSGLHLQITANGARSWILRYKSPVTGTRRNLGLGPYPEKGLAAARQLAGAAKSKIREGLCPVQERENNRKAVVAEAARAKAAAFTFAQAVEKTIAAREAEFSNLKHARQWRATLDTYAAPILGSLPVADIERADVLRVLAPIWTTKTETASRLRGRIEAVLSWARVNGFRDGENPARWKGNLDHDLAAPTKLKKKTAAHWPALQYEQAAEFFEALSGRDGLAAKALAFAMLTAARSGEVRGATWSEIDMDSEVWIIPASRMKAGKEHQVPLSKAALDLLTAMPRDEGNDVVFWAPRGGQFSDMALSAVMRRMHDAEVKAQRKGFVDRVSGRPAVPHGLRSSFRDWIAEKTNWPSDLAEMALSHTLGNAVEAAYRRGDMIEKRRRMMEAWADYVSGKARAEVIDIARRG